MNFLKSNSVVSNSIEPERYTWRYTLVAALLTHP